MNKMIVIVGQTASGKDTLAGYLNELGYKRILEYTTRPQRPEEHEGVEYHFIDEATFEKMISNDEFAQYKTFNATFGKCSYGLRYEDIKENCIYITNPGALKILIEKKVPLESFYLKVSNEEIINRILTGKRKDELEEVKSRLIRDKALFEELETYVDHIIDAEHPTEEIAKSILNIINKI